MLFTKWENRWHRNYFVVKGLRQITEVYPALSAGLHPLRLGFAAPSTFATLALAQRLKNGLFTKPKKVIKNKER